MREEVRKEWEESDITFNELGRKYGLSASTIRSWKRRYGWKRATVENDATYREAVATGDIVDESIIDKAGLTEKHKMFCLFYIKSLNATEAYMKSHNAIRSTAGTEGHRLLNTPKIRDVIDALKRERMRAALIDVDDVLDMYVKIAFADMTDFVEFGTEEVETINDVGEPTTYQSNYVRFKNSDEVDGTLITEVKKGKDGVSFKLADKMRALDALAKYVDFMSEDAQRDLKEERLYLENTRLKEEIKMLTGDGEGDAHERMNQYMKAIGVDKVKSVFDDEEA